MDGLVLSPEFASSGDRARRVSLKCFLSPQPIPADLATALGQIELITLRVISSLLVCPIQEATEPFYLRICLKPLPICESQATCLDELVF